ncbi:MAG: FMN-binding glutamate synthase family protein, partial [Sulfurovaceae bacterium]|nr:FMN-binding glutamate synthase family protein [Sulfurovaceae bacterium]
MLDIILFFFIFFMFLWYLYDRFVQRSHALVINYPIIGRMRYFLEAIREPFRQYFGSEDVFDSRDKIEWVYKAARDKTNFISFSPSDPQKNPKFMLKHAFAPLNDDEVDESLSVTFGADRPYPFVSKSIISRSAMSDGAISPEGTKAFSIGAYRGQFPINTGEGGLTTNFLITHQSYSSDYMDTIKLSLMQQKLYLSLEKIVNRYFAIDTLRSMVLNSKVADTYNFDYKDLCFYRVNWNSELEKFPKKIPKDVADIILQMGSGLYGVRDKEGKFDPIR